MKHIQTILIRNFISPISVAIFILAAGLLILGEVRDAWFISFVILVNSIVASVQEIRAYLMLKKIEIMSTPRAQVVRGGQIFDVIFSDLIVGDKILLKSGDEIPADGKIIKANSLEINEAMLTGESLAVSKCVGDQILSGSIVVAGDAEVEVLAVGGDTKAGKMTKKLKSYKPSLTPIQRQISRVISLLTYFALALALMVIWRYSKLGEEHVVILKTITSAAVVVVPEGLLLASSLFFAYGSLKLLQAKVLPQKISAIEDMALLEVLATDKTGTLTSPEIVFDSLINKSKYDQSYLEAVLVAINSQGEHKNSTARAINQRFSEVCCSFEIIESVPFSSARKLSALSFSHENKKRAVVFGAPEFILKNSPSKTQLQVEIDELAAQGLRVLLLAEFSEFGDFDNLFSKNLDLQPLAIITLKNDLRKNVRQTVDFLQQRGVSIRVISGDNPRTVSFIAREAGIRNPEKFITGAEMAELSPDEFDKSVLENTIFARVLPEQKERIIKTFQKNNLYTGMIGDGVNDALAIKRSDLGISMFDAAPATRRVADLVLMDNSFTSLPSGVRIGNRIMLSIEIIAVLFFHKIVMGVTILFACLLAGVNYPFLPRHLTFMNFILVTLPTLLLTIFPPIPLRKVNPKKFWRDTFWAVLPIALLSGLAVATVYLVLLGGNYSQQNLRGVLATVVAVATYFGFTASLVSERMFATKFTKNTAIRRSIYLLVTIFFAVLVFGVGFLREFFEFNFPVFEKISLLVLVVFGVSFLQFWLSGRKRKSS